MGKLVYFKFMAEDAEVMKENLTTEQIGELFLAVMDYLETGEVADVSKAIKYPYSDYRKRVDRARSSYEETCAKRTESGKKGGTAKAKNAAKAAATTPAQKVDFKPPTLSQFKNAVNKIVGENDFDDVDDYYIEAFFDKLKEQSWNFNGMAIQSRKDWEEIIYARFHDPLSSYHDGLFVSYHDLFCYLISTYPQLHHRWNDIDAVLSNLIHDCWADGSWNVNGCVFEQREWKVALDALVADWLKEIPL